MYKISIDVPRVAEMVRDNYGSSAKAARATGLSSAWFNVAINDRRGSRRVNEETLEKLMAGLNAEQRKELFGKKSLDLPTSPSDRVGAFVMNLQPMQRDAILQLLKALGMPRDIVPD